MIKKIKSSWRNIPQYWKITVAFFICNFMQRATSVITTPIFTRILSTDEYGKYSVFTSWMNIGLAVCVMQLYGSAYSKGLVKFEEQKDEYASSMQKLVFFLALIWIVICHILKKQIGIIIPSLNEAEMFMMMGLIWTTCIFNLWATKQRVELKWKWLLVITTLTCVLEPVISITMVINSTNKVDARILARLLIELLLYIPLFIIQIIKGRLITKKDRVYWQYAFRMNIPLIPHYLSTVVLSTADRIMIADIVSESKAGIYSLAYSVSSLLLIVNAALIQVIQPWMFKKMKENKWHEIGKVSYICLCIVAGLNTMFILTIPEVIYIFASKEYYEAIYVMPPIVMSVFFMFMYTLFSSVEFYFEKTSYISVATFSGAVLNIVLNLYFIKTVGYEAAGYTTLLCYMFFCWAHYIFMKIILKKNKLDMFYDPKILIVISLLFVFLGFILMMTFQNMFIRYSVLGVILIAIVKYRANIKGFVNNINQKKEG